MSFPYPFFPVQFTRDGTVFQQSDVDALIGGVSGADRPSDLFVMSHGWNNNMTEATSLYDGLISRIKTRIDANPALASRRYAICGVLWPSKKFDDKDLIPSGAAALDDAVTTAQLRQRVRDLKSLYAASEWPAVSTAPPPDFDRIEALMDNVENDPAAQTEVVNLLRPLLPQEAKSADDASDRFFSSSAASLIDKLSAPLTPPPPQAGSGGASVDPFALGTASGIGGAAGFRDVMGGIKAGFLHLLNFTTYYVMKSRAGDVGVKGVAPIIQKLRDTRSDLSIHMIGHSFGCRLTAAAINALPADEKYRPDTVLLLQGAFSHNGFAFPDDDRSVPRGAFRDVVEHVRVRGPILITHTRNDKAVGIAYPIASRINGVKAAALGDANDVFGGLGSNGTQTAVTTPEGVAGRLLPAGSTGYGFANGVKPATPYNLRADDFISGHSDVVNDAVGFVLAVGMAASRLRGAHP